MTLFDLRASPTHLAAAAASFSHAATPSCVAVCETNSHQAVTGAYVGIVGVWDVRRWEGKQKVLSVDWWRGLVGVGGEGGLEDGVRVHIGTFRRGLVAGPSGLKGLDQLSTRLAKGRIKI